MGERTSVFLAQCVFVCSPAGSYNTFFRLTFGTNFCDVGLFIYSSLVFMPDSLLKRLPEFTPAAIACAVVLLIFAFFSAVLYLATNTYLIAEASWPLILLLAAFIPSVRYEELASSYSHLCRALVVIAFVYIAMQFPFYPVINDGVYTSFITNTIAWVIALTVTVLAWWRPLWLLASGAYLPWVKALAEHASGFLYDRLLDITPLFQIMLFCGVVALVFGLFGWIQNSQRPTIVSSVMRYTNLDEPSNYRSFATQTSALLVFIVVSFHFAGYLFSGVAKASLDGGFWYWPFINELQNIYFAGVINQQMIWLDLPSATSIFTSVMEWIGRPMSLMVFFGQLAAILAFSHKRVFIGLLLFYDLMHIGIFVSQGANFFTWALVNVAVIVAVKTLPARFFGLRPMLLSIALMVFAQFVYGKFYRVPNLGWYDSKAVNNGYFLANLVSGDSVRVPIAFFMFYSYPISHMSYGHPEGKYVPTDTNGGTKSAKINDKSVTCDFADNELVSTKRHYWNADAVTQFIQQYHLLAERWMPNGPSLWLNLYWHHFWSPLSIHQDFKNISLPDVKSYTLVIESTCLDVVDFQPVGEIVSTTHWEVPIVRN